MSTQRTAGPSEDAPFLVSTLPTSLFLSELGIGDMGHRPPFPPWYLNGRHRSFLSYFCPDTLPMSFVLRLLFGDPEPQHLFSILDAYAPVEVISLTSFSVSTR